MDPARDPTYELAPPTEYGDIFDVVLRDLAKMDDDHDCYKMSVVDSLSSTLNATGTDDVPLLDNTDSGQMELASSIDHKVIKNTLRDTIMTKRAAEGKETSFEDEMLPPTGNQMSPDEVEKEEKRKARNRNSAAKSRQRKEEERKKMLLDHETMEEVNVQLKVTNAKLEEMLKLFQDGLADHLKKGCHLQEKGLLTMSTACKIPEIEKLMFNPNCMFNIQAPPNDVYPVTMDTDWQGSLAQVPHFVTEESSDTTNIFSSRNLADNLGTDAIAQHEHPPLDPMGFRLKSRRTPMDAIATSVTPRNLDSLENIQSIRTALEEDTQIPWLGHLNRYTNDSSVSRSSDKLITSNVVVTSYQNENEREMSNVVRTSFCNENSVPSQTRNDKESMPIASGFMSNDTGGREGEITTSNVCTEDSEDEEYEDLVRSFSGEPPQKKFKQASPDEKFQM